MGSMSYYFGSLDFRSFIDNLESGGWFDFVFPFMLVYAVVFTILNYAEIFDDKKPVKVIISLVFSLFAVSFDITSSGRTLADLMKDLFPGVTAFTMGILALYIVVGMLGVDLKKFFGKDEDENTNKILKYVLGSVGLLVVVYYYGVGFGWWGDGYYGAWDWLIGHGGLLRDPLLYILAILGTFFWWISKDDKKPNPNAGTEEKNN